MGAIRVLSYAAATEATLLCPLRRIDRAQEAGHGDEDNSESCIRGDNGLRQSLTQSPRYRYTEGPHQRGVGPRAAPDCYHRDVGSVRLLGQGGSGWLSELH